MNRVWKQVVLLTFALLAVISFKVDAQADSYRYWDGRQWRNPSSNLYTSNPIEVTYEVKYCYEEAYKMIDLVNAERRKAGVPELVAKDELMDVAMMRAAETALYWSHTRPDGSGYRSASIFSDGENILAGDASAKGANATLVNSPGHYATMMEKNYAYAGYGYVEIYEDSEWMGSYWVQIFSTANKYYEDGFDLYHPENNKPIQWDKMTIGQRKDYTTNFTAKVNSTLISLKLKIDNQELTEGSVTAGRLYTYSYDAKWDFDVSVPLTLDQYNVKVTDKDICIWKDGKIKGLKAGTTSIEFTLKKDSRLKANAQITVRSKPIKNGSKVMVSGNTYKVTSTKSKTVSFYKGKADAKNVSVPKTVKIQGKTYKVTAISANAFKDNKKLAGVTVGSNVTTIGSKAFYGCKNLKKITVKSVKLKSVGKNAFKGVHKKAVIKVPKSKLAKYKKLFRNRGQKKTVKIKK